MKAILTPRLVLREMGPKDLPFLLSMLGDSEVMRFWPAPLSEEGARDWIKKQMERYAQDGCGYWLALRRDTGVPVGQAGVLMLDWGGGLKPALGYMIHRPFWRMGYATEAAQASCTFIWNVLARELAWTLIRPENEASAAVARKLGMMAGDRIEFHGLEHVVYSRRAPGLTSVPEIRQR